MKTIRLFGQKTNLVIFFQIKRILNSEVAALGSIQCFFCFRVCLVSSAEPSLSVSLSYAGGNAPMMTHLHL